jgi:hypothetical protein
VPGTIATAAGGPGQTVLAREQKNRDDGVATATVVGAG